MTTKLESIAPLTEMESMLAGILKYVASKGAIAELTCYAVEDEHGNGSVMEERVTQSVITTTQGLTAWKERLASNPGEVYSVAITTQLSNRNYLLTVNNMGVLTDLINLDNNAEIVYNFTLENDLSVSEAYGPGLLYSQTILRDHITNHLAHKERIINSLPVKVITPGGV